MPVPLVGVQSSPTLPTSADGVSAIDEVAQVPGLVLSAGYSGHGFKPANGEQR